MSQFKRSELEVLLDILKAIRLEARPTRLMYLSNTSWMPLKRGLSILLQAGLVETRAKDIPDKRTKSLFYINPRGEECITEWEKATTAIKKAVNELSLKALADKPVAEPVTQPTA